MKKLLFLTFLSSILLSCSEDNGDNSIIIPLFFEKYDGVVWENENDNQGTQTHQFIFNNTEPKSFTMYDLDIQLPPGECYPNPILPEYELIESENSFQLTYYMDFSPEIVAPVPLSYIMTVSNDGNSLLFQRTTDLSPEVYEPTPDEYYFRTSLENPCPN
jgi:hypothetical protein